MVPTFRWTGTFVLLALFGLPGPAQGVDPIPDSRLDINQDGGIDSNDLLLLLPRWGIEGIPTPAPTATPDPNAFITELDYVQPQPLRMVRIPAGTFMMGSPDTERSRDDSEGPVHQVTIDYDFFMSETEVTQAQWEAVMGALPNCDAPAEYGLSPDTPVYCVARSEAQDFMAALNALSPQGTFRLPSEAEWEYACRARNTKRFHFGNSLGCSDGPECEDCDADPTIREKGSQIESTPMSNDFEPGIAPLPAPNRSDFMWFCANSGSFVQEVRQLRPNAFRLYDMSGNVFEWVEDLYHNDYIGAPTDGSVWVEGGSPSLGVIRGGSFDATANFCRSATRFFATLTIQSPRVGFRVVWTP